MVEPAAILLPLPRDGRRTGGHALFIARGGLDTLTARLLSRELAAGREPALREGARRRAADLGEERRALRAGRDPLFLDELSDEMRDNPVADLSALSASMPWQA